jgi:hypothetical protein
MKPKRENLNGQTLIISGSCMCKKLPSDASAADIIPIPVPIQ